MKATGIVRRVDDLGRVVIPKEIRRNLEIDERDPVEIYTDENSIILKKYIAADTCVFCGEAEDITKLKGQAVCQYCLQEFAKDGGTK